MARGKRRASLSEAFSPPASAAESIPAEAPPEETAPAARAPSRVGLKAIAVHIDRAAHQQLRILAIEQESSGQALMVEALNDLFRKHGKPPIA